MYCRNCGKDNLEGSQFCIGCGAQLQAAPQPVQAPQPVALKTSGMAIAALVLGILAFLTCGITALPGLILGIIATVQINAKRDEVTGQGLAIGGIALSGVALVMLPIFAAILFPVFARARGAARSQVCLNHMKQIGTSMRMYANDYDNKFPVAANWSDAVRPYNTRALEGDRAYVCPGATNQQCGFAVNSAAAGQPLQVFPSGRTLLLFESDRGWNGSGGREAMITQPRHGFFTTVCIDGHAIKVFPGYENGLQWSP